MSVFSVAGGQPLRGSVRVPGDKSISHRALLLAALADGTSVIRGLAEGDDVARTRAAVVALGAELDDDRVSGGAGRLHEASEPIDVGNSGTTIRLAAGLCAGFDWLTVLYGDSSIARRPMDRVSEPLRAMGASVDGRDGGRYPPLAVRGGALHGVDYTLPVASAQVKSALLLAGLSAEGETVVRQPVPTRAHTEEMLAACGADIEVEGLTVRVRPSTLQPFELDVPGDPSHAAFWLVAACVVPGSSVTVEGLYWGPARTAFADVLARMGAAVEVEHTGGGTVSVTARHGPLHATDVGGDEVAALIDEIPVLAVAAALAEGVSVFSDATELRAKESDRIATVVAGLRAFGAQVQSRPDGLVVTGGRPLRATRVASEGDHRVAMAMAVAGLAAEGTTTIEGWEAVATSYPGFERHLAALAAAGAPSPRP